MKHQLRMPLFLMALTILVITIFQVYWLRKSFREEKNLFTARTNLLFRETIFRLQASKLKLDSNINIRVEDKQGIISMTNILQEKVRDSAGPKRTFKTNVMVTMTHNDLLPRRDSDIQYQVRRSLPRGRSCF